MAIRRCRDGELVVAHCCCCSVAIATLSARYEKENKAAEDARKEAKKAAREAAKDANATAGKHLVVFDTPLLLCSRW